MSISNCVIELFLDIIELVRFIFFAGFGGIAVGRKRGPERVALSFRCEPGRMKDIQEAAVLLGTDANGVLNDLVIEGLPGLLGRAKKRHEELLSARKAMDYDLAVISDPLLRRLLLAGRAAGEGDRQSAMEAEAGKAYGEPYPTPDMLAKRACEIDDILQRRHQLSLMTENRRGWSLEEAERKQLGNAAERLDGQLTVLLEDWRKFVHPEDQTAGAGSGKDAEAKKATPRKRTPRG